MSDEKELETGPDNIEQARDLFALEQMAGAEQVPGQTSDGQAGEPAPERNLKLEIVGLLSIGVGVLGPVFPTLKEVYTEPTIDQAATVTAALCDKHGWLQGDGLTKYQEEIAAAIVLGPLALSTYAAVNKDLAAMKKKPEKKPEPQGENLLPALEVGPSAQPVEMIPGAMAGAGVLTV